MSVLDRALIKAYAKSEKPTATEAAPEPSASVATETEPSTAARTIRLDRVLAVPTEGPTGDQRFISLRFDIPSQLLSLANATADGGAGTETPPAPHLLGVADWPAVENKAAATHPSPPLDVTGSAEPVDPPEPSGLSDPAAPADATEPADGAAPDADGQSDGAGLAQAADAGEPAAATDAATHVAKQALPIEPGAADEPEAKSSPVETRPAESLVETTHSESIDDATPAETTAGEQAENADDEQAEHVDDEQESAKPRIHASHASCVPAPHFLANRAVPASEDPRVPPAEEADQPSGPQPQADPAAAETDVQATMPEFQAVTREQGLVKAAYEVDRFAWAQACDSILEAAQPDLIRTCERLLVETARGRNVILVTGVRPSVGRTTSALCLARQLASLGKRVVLVDADFDDPGVARSLGIAPAAGWDQLDQDKLEVGEVLVQSVVDGLTVAPLQKDTDTRCSTEESAAWSCLLERLRETYEIVVIDGPSLADDARGFFFDQESNRGVDLALLVQDDPPADRHELTPLVTALLAAGTEPFGIVRNAHRCGMSL